MTETGVAQDITVLTRDDLAQTGDLSLAATLARQAAAASTWRRASRWVWRARPWAWISCSNNRQMKSIGTPSPARRLRVFVHYSML